MLRFRDRLVNCGKAQGELTALPLNLGLLYRIHCAAAHAPMLALALALALTLTFLSRISAESCVGKSRPGYRLHCTCI